MYKGIPYTFIFARSPCSKVTLDSVLRSAFISVLLFQGVIEITESPVNKFQLLINVTDNVHSNERVNYHLRHTEDSVFVELLPRHSPSRAVVPGGDEEKIYLQLLFVTVASLVLVVFVVSIIFSCWWLKSQKPPYQAKTTDAAA
ncbi:hypothetical protein P879_10755 [Paragonimus westermani]|uniref:Cadherin domain-containing protein n=1 Tax=Paragonimus westermani TaxID=34504 RepID=A0A8T0D4V5_9TREM|nr:hypothetical protein P879_10755 [Paragonimus westermani]